MLREKQVENLRKKYTEGMQIELTEMRGEPQMPPGLKGVVDYVDDAGQVHMKWENGSSLAINVEEDTFHTISQEMAEQAGGDPGEEPEQGFHMDMG